MKFKIKGLTSDLAKENEGVWVPLSIGGEVCVKRAGNPGWKARDRKLKRPYRNRLRRGMELPEEVVENILCELLAFECLTGWRDIPFVDEKGKAAKVPFSSKTAFDLLKDEAMKDFREEVATAALTKDYFVDVDEPDEEDEKN